MKLPDFPLRPVYFFLLILAGTVAALAGFDLPARAGEPLAVEVETITVTADKRSSDVQAVPTSMTVLTGVDLEDSRIFTSEDLFNTLPNIHLYKAGPAADIASGVSIRGIAQTMSGSPSFGFFIDDVYYTEYDANLLDVERVELLRGPQGTLYGRNTLGGALNIITRKPSNGWTGSLGAGIGNYNHREIRGMVSGPLADDRLFIRMAGQYDGSDGYFTNRADGDDAVNDPENADGRISLRYTPSPDLTLDLTADALKYRSRYTEFVPLSQLESDTYAADVDYKGNSLKEAMGTHLRGEYDGGAYRFLSISALRLDDNRLDHDMDFTQMDGQRQLYQRDYATLSQELRLVSDDPDSAWEWLVGLYGFREEQDHNLIYTLGADWAAPSMGMPAGDYPITGESDIRGAAVFGEISRVVADTVKLTGGLRYDRETQDFAYDAGGVGGAVGSTDATFEALLPKLVISGVSDSRYMPYAKASRGYKAGGFNLQNNQGEKFAPEYTWNYEAGIKTQWPVMGLTLNAALFHIDWRDMQVNASNGVDFVTRNAAAASSDGVEFELTARPAQGLKVSGSLAYTRSEFDDYHVAATSGGMGMPSSPARDFSGNRVPAVPDATARLSMTWRGLSGLFAGVDYTYTGKVYMNNENDLSESGYNLFNARLGVEKEGFEIYLWAKNVFDESYATTYVDFRESGGGLWARPGNPRTFGLSIGYRF